MANYCSIVGDESWKALRGSLTELNIKRLFELHNGVLPTKDVALNEIYEEYGGLYGCVGLQSKLPRSGSHLEYSNYLKSKGISVLIGEQIESFKDDYGYEAYNPISNTSKGIVCKESEIFRYKQQLPSDYGFAIQLAKKENKKVLVYRTMSDGDVVIMLDNSLKLEDVGTKEDVDFFEEWQKYQP